MRSVAFALYRLAARLLLPPGFRHEYGIELEEAVATRLAAARPFRFWILLFMEFTDLVRTAVREWWGSATGARGEGRVARGGSMLDGIMDLRTGARNLIRRPGLALGATATIALGIGATTTIYSVVDGVVLRPLPFENPGTLVAVGAIAAGAGSVDPGTGLQDLAPMSSTDLEGLRERARSFEALGGMAPHRILMSDENGVEQFVGAATVSPELFEVLGVTPALGRTFLPEEFEQARGLSWGAVMISHDYWQTRHGGDPNVLGRTVHWSTSSDGARPTIVGILPRDFRPPETFFPEGELPEIYNPMAASTPERRMVMFGLSVLGRLTAGTTLEQARTEAQTISAELAVAAPTSGTLPGGRARAIGLNDLHAETVGNAGRTLWVFLGAAALLLLLTAMNAATLLLARALDRQQEFGVRVALGAGRLHVVRLLLGEAGLLSAVGGALGILLAYSGVEAFLRSAPASIPRLSAVAVDERVLVVAVLATLGTGVAAGLVPALGLSRRSVWEGLQTRGRTASDPSSRVRWALVGGQLALAMVLLCGAGLLFSSFMRLRAADPGFDPDGLVAMSPTATRPAALARDQVRSFHQRWDPVLAAQVAVPGVRSAVGASGLPFQAPTWAPRLTLPGDSPETVREGIAGYAITPGYFETLGVEVLRGRGIGPEDGPDAEPVVVVNEAFVRTQLDGGDALGMLLVRRPEVMGPFEPISMRIVGVVENVVQGRAEEGPRPAIYLPYTQADFPQLTPWWSVVRSDLPADVVIPELRRSLAGSDWRLQNVTTMRERIALTQITPRFQTLLIGAFAVVAMLLAAAGLHGSLAHAVRRRQRELGVRIALGADRGSVLRMVLAQGMRVSLLGLAVGIGGTLALSRVLAAFLYDMEPYDPFTLLGVAAVLILVSVVACLAPARRATAVDPVRVLGAE
jgi:predicted permease